MNSFIEKTEKNALRESGHGRNTQLMPDRTGLSRTGEKYIPDGRALTLSDDAARGTGNPEISKGITAPKKVAADRIFVEETDYTELGETEKDPATFHSIFDTKTESHQHSVTLPQILTVFASPADKIAVEKEAGKYVLPPIQENDTGRAKSQTSHNKLGKKGSSKRNKTELFDYRAQNLQQNAREKQIKLLKQRGYGHGADKNISSRFVVQPYEGACDDVAVAKRTPVGSPRVVKKQPGPPHNESASSQAEESTKTLSPPADEETLAKIETAFKDWAIRKLSREEEEPFRIRKRSSSHSPTRSTARDNESNKFSSSLTERSDFLHHKGNLRQKPTRNPGARKDSGRTYRAIASPAISRRQFVGTQKGLAPINFETTTITPLGKPGGTNLHPPEARGLRKLSPLATPRNKRLIELRSGEAALSSSLPDLHKDDRSSTSMDHKGHRPRTSSLRKTRNSSPRNSPQTQRKATPKLTEKRKKNGPSKPKESNTKKAEPSPATPRRVTLNTSLPTASPTFQRAMKGMRLPDKDYSEIFVQNRRDSILQSYRIPESALNSFRDDYDLNQVESSSNALEEMTNRFKEDVKIYKDGWDATPKTADMQKKSILKKRRQSVDDLEIGTRKNLAKYLESKLDANS